MGRPRRPRNSCGSIGCLLSEYAAVPDVEKKKSRKASTPLKAHAVSDLWAEMRQLLERHKREHQGNWVQLVAYLTAGCPDAARSAAGFQDLPPEAVNVIN